MYWRHYSTPKVSGSALVHVHVLDLVREVGRSGLGGGMRHCGSGSGSGSGSGVLVEGAGEGGLAQGLAVVGLGEDEAGAVELAVLGGV